MFGSETKMARTAVISTIRARLGFIERRNPVNRPIVCQHKFIVYDKKRVTQPQCLEVERLVPKTLAPSGGAASGRASRFPNQIRTGGRRDRRVQEHQEAKVRARTPLRAGGCWPESDRGGRIGFPATELSTDESLKVHDD